MPDNLTTGAREHQLALRVLNDAGHADDYTADQYVDAINRVQGESLNEGRAVERDALSGDIPVDADSLMLHVAAEDLLRAAGLEQYDGDQYARALDLVQAVTAVDCGNRNAVEVGRELKQETFLLLTMRGIDEPTSDQYLAVADTARQRLVRAAVEARAEFGNR